MSPSSERTRPRLLATALLLGALLAGGLSYATWATEIAGKPHRGLAQYFFARQDMWLLDAQMLLLALLALWAWTVRPAARTARRPGAGGQNALILVGILLAVLLGRYGRDFVFQGYSPSRDELMVEMAAAYLAEGRIGWPIAPDWLPYRTAMVPEFYSPYGADTHWTAIYLPVHAAIRALFIRFGEAALAAPVTLGIGLLALWQVARTLMPERPDGQAVTMVMALTSVQLLATAMTPYAMTSHFAFDMVWLMLVLRGGTIGHGLAGLVALLAAGLHQWHFPLLFIGPFLLWLLARRQWRAALFHGLVAAAMMVVWARLWPLVLIQAVGPPPPTDIHRMNGILDKLESLFGRLDSWQPLLNNARLLAWNNLLLVPLALMSLAAIRWRALFRDPPIVLALLLAVGVGMGLALYQGYGWGFRYMHGGVGALALLAGIGWTALARGGDGKAFRLVLASGALALLGAAWLLADTRAYVDGYARAMAAIRASRADVVLVDLRGGYYMTDLVRFEAGRPGRPAVMALQGLRLTQLDRLCARYRVAIADETLYRAAGIHPVPSRFRGSQFIAARRAHLAALGCGRVIERAEK
jgi:hypothetical protein